MKKARYILFVIPFSFGLIWPTVTSAQVLAHKDSTRLPKVIKRSEFFTFHQNQFKTDTTKSDTLSDSFTDLLRYFPYYHNYKLNLGNMGSPQFNLLMPSPTLYPNTAAPRFTFDALDDYRVNLLNFKFYNLSQPYARVTYYNGAQKEEGIEAFVSANAHPNQNFSIIYRKDGSEGFYSRMRSSHNRFGFGGAIRTRGGRYGHIYLLGYNDSYFEENGGLTTDTLFESPMSGEINRRGIPIRLQQAKNTSTHRQLEGRHFVNFGPKTAVYLPKKDTTHADTLDFYRIQPRFSLQHKYVIGARDYAFEDGTPDFRYYQTDSFSTPNQIFDRIVLNTISNQFAFEGVIWQKGEASRSHSLKVKAGAGFHAFNYYSYAIINRQNSHLLKLEDGFVPVSAQITYSLSEWYNLQLDGNSILSGFNAGNTAIGLRQNLETARQTLGLAMEWSNTLPDLQMQVFRSTFARWSLLNNLLPENKISANLHYLFKPWKAKVVLTYHAQSNYTFIDTSLSPRQHASGISVGSLSLSKVFHLGPLVYDVQVSTQWSDSKGVLNLPEFLTYQSVYLKFKIFGGDLAMRTGFEGFYTSSFMADGYSPLLRRFYTQNKKETGSSPIADFFIGADIDRVQLFVKIANIFEGATGYNYYGAAGYPLPDRAFKFGVRWIMLN